MPTARTLIGKSRKFTSDQLKDMGERAALIGLPCEFPYAGEQARAAWEIGWRSVPEKKRGSLKVKFEGSVPKSLREWCEKHPERVQAIGPLGDQPGYDALLRPGWRKYDDLVHSIIESTATATLNGLKWAVPCDCKECEELKRAETI